MTIDHDRLNGWKDIAAFLGKGVRTVQRWEREHGLPIHRQGAHGDLIFAYRSELEAWVRAGGAARQSSRVEGDDQPASGADVSATPFEDWTHLVPTPPAGAPPWTMPFRSRGAAAAAVLIAAGVIAVVAGWRPAATLKASRPVRWHVTADTLHVHDQAGRLLWSHRFDFDFEARLQYLPTSLDGTAPVVIDDIDEDGQREVVAAGPAPINLADKGLYVFNADGSLRFRFEPRHRVRFGDEEFAGPWLHRRTFVLRPPGGGPAQLWLVYTHGQWFPSLLLRLGPEGQVLAEYWSDGHIDLVALARWRGGTWMFVAGTNNETRGASLALFPMGQVRGSAPSVNPTYRCTSCPAGGPAHFVVFPRRCLSLAINGQEWVSRLWVDDSERAHILVEEGSPTAAGPGDTAAWYTLGPDLSVADAEFTDHYHAGHARLEREGVLDHPVAVHGRSVLLPVRRWVAGRYEPLPPATAGG